MLPLARATQSDTTASAATQFLRALLAAARIEVAAQPHVAEAVVMAVEAAAGGGGGEGSGAPAASAWVRRAARTRTRTRAPGVSVLFYGPCSATARACVPSPNGASSFSPSAPPPHRRRCAYGAARCWRR